MSDSPSLLPSLSPSLPPYLPTYLAGLHHQILISQIRDKSDGRDGLAAVVVLAPLPPSLPTSPGFTTSFSSPKYETKSSSWLKVTGVTGLLLSLW